MQIEHLPKISALSIKHKKQRYPTCGDYYLKGKIWQFRVSKTKSDFEFLILIHELIEWYLIQKKGFPVKDIDLFDIRYEKDRKKGDVSEPGDDPKSPYYHEHQFATHVEKIVASMLDVDWEEYEKTIQEL